MHLTRMYDVQAPGYPKREAGRGPIMLPLRPPHELIEEEAKNTPGLRFKLREAVDAGRLPPAYTSHPVVAEAIEPPLPVALYCDSVSYTRADSVVGVWVINLITGLRHMVGLLRKAIVCQCGCRGHCTWWPILNFLRWSFAAMARGVYPARRHDDTRFRAEEDFRQEAAGKPMAFRGVMLWAKGDWVEFCERFSFPNHASSDRPCFLCSCPAGPEL